MKSIYIGNLPYNTTHQQVQDLFAQFGDVLSSRMIVDKATRKFKGYAFVEMEKGNALTAVSMLNGMNYNGRTIRVSLANDEDNSDENPKDKA